MSTHAPKINRWLVAPLKNDVERRINQMADCTDVVRISVLPDVHLAQEFCVGTVVATRNRIMPQAVGGDIGCGMAAIRLEAKAANLITKANAATMFRCLRQLVPVNKHPAKSIAKTLPECLRCQKLSEPWLARRADRDGRVQLGTLGRGNHFLEFQKDESGMLWLMLHSGSRAMGQLITAFHLQRAIRDSPLPYFEADSKAGRAYLNDQRWARLYAQQNRLAMLETVSELFKTVWQIETDRNSLIESDHNHVRREEHDGEPVWVHRKGAQRAERNEPGVIPGSMGTPSYHVAGRGHEPSLRSSSHGAGRNQSRKEAARSISDRSLVKQMQGVLFDTNRTRLLRDEAPSAYKDIRRVLKAQKQLVKITRVLTPLLSYKG